MITAASSFSPALAQLAAQHTATQPSTLSPENSQAQAIAMGGRVELGPAFFPGGFAPAFVSTQGTGGPSMAELVGGTESLPIDTVLVLIAEDVYLDESAGPDHLTGWTRLGPNEIPEGIIPPGGHVDENGIFYGPDGLEGAIYVNEYGDYVVAYRGTDITDGGDLKTNAQRSGLGQSSAQDEFAMQLAVNMEREFTGHVIFTGHSLGGGLAISSSLATGAPAVVFNPAGTNDNIIKSATTQRNESQGTNHTTGDVVDEANSGNIRVYQNEGDWVTHAQENSGAANLPAAIGHRVQVEDHIGLPPVLDSSSSTSLPEAIFMDYVLGRIPSLGAGAHHDIDNTAAGVFTSTYAVAEVNGNTVTMTTPSENRGLPPGDVLIESITFSDSDEGRDAQRIFLMTGNLPENMSGVDQVAVTHNSWGGASISQTTHYENGIPTASEQTVIQNGEEILRIHRTHDAEGDVVDDATTYTFTTTPQTDAEARELSMVLFGVPDGPIQVGESYTVTLGEEQMSENRTAVPSWSVDANEPATGILEGMPENGLFAVDIVTDPTSNWVSELAIAQHHSATFDAPIEGVVTDAEGEPLLPETTD